MRAERPILSAVSCASCLLGFFFFFPSPVSSGRVCLFFFSTLETGPLCSQQMLWAPPRFPGASHRWAAVRPTPAPCWEACPWVIGVSAVLGAKQLMWVRNSSPSFQAFFSQWDSIEKSLFQKPHLIQLLLLWPPSLAPSNQELYFHAPCAHKTNCAQCDPQCQVTA